MSDEEKIKLVEEMIDRFINDLRRNPEVRISFFDAESAREQTLVFLHKKLGIS